MPLLTITTAYSPATDLGYLLVKHPDKLREVDLTCGKAYVFFPEATKEKCTVALLVDIDPVGLTRRGENPSLADYVSDRSYAVSSFLAVALSRVFRSAMTGVCKDKPELATAKLPLEICITALPCRGGEEMMRRLFEPLGYNVTSGGPLLSYNNFPEWGLSPYLNVTLQHNSLVMKDVLTHLYVLIPVLDDEKHYYIGDDEVKKLVKHGVGWLDKHPERELITRRYLGGRGGLVREAREQIGPVVMEEPVVEETPEAKVEEKLSLNRQRIEYVVKTLLEFKDTVKSVVDLGCGEGKLLVVLATTQQFNKLAGLDVALRPLQIAKYKLRKALRSNKPYSTTGDPDAFVQLYHGSVTYRDARIENFDAAIAVEVVEHLDPYRLDMFEKVVFGRIHPCCVVVTTPNVEYNVLFHDMKTKFRHRDHQFEWTRAEFENWCKAVCERYGYNQLQSSIGEVDEKVGAPTQGCVFTRCH